MSTVTEVAEQQPNRKESFLAGESQVHYSSVQTRKVSSVAVSIQDEKKGKKEKFVLDASVNEVIAEETSVDEAKSNLFKTVTNMVCAMAGVGEY